MTTNWDPESPMWWHRSNAHRTLILLLIGLFYLVAIPAMMGWWLLVALTAASR